MHVLLVHGMGRTPLSMSRLARDLRRSGHVVHQFGYSVTVESMDRIAIRLRNRLEQAGGTGGAVVVIGHSLGGVLTRIAVSREPPMSMPPRHLIMIGPPNKSPLLARRLRWLWPYRLVNGDAGQRLADPAFHDSLPIPTVPYTIIAGIGGRRDRWSAFAGEPNDGLVARDETLCRADDAIIEVPARHTFLMNHPAVRTVIHNVLRDVEQRTERPSP